MLHMLMHFWNLSNNFMFYWMYAYTCMTEKNLLVQYPLIRDITLTGKPKLSSQTVNEFEFILQIVIHLDNVHFLSKNFYFKV